MNNEQREHIADVREAFRQARATVDRWGAPITRERAQALKEILRNWTAEADHGRQAGPFDRTVPDSQQRVRLKLTGSDVYWLQERLREEYRPKHAPKPILHLEGADLSGANLTGAILWDTNFRGANLKGAILTVAYLDGANLTNANLSDANLTGCNLKGAILTGADLTRANVYHARGIRLVSKGQVLQLAGIMLLGALGLLLWTLLDGITHWTTLLPWLSGGLGVLLTAGALILLQLRGGNTRRAQRNFRAIGTFLQANVVALFLFLAGVSHIYQVVFLWFGGFTSAASDYHGWFMYQFGWFVDILLFNVFDVYTIPVSPIRPDALWSQTIVFVLNLILVAVVVQAALRSFSDIQAWRLRIRGEETPRSMLLRKRTAETPRT